MGPVGGISLRLRVATLLLALVGLAAGGANAHHCATWETDDAEADLDTGAGVRFYVVFRESALPCTPCFDWWVYQEANGIDGLQRKDEFIGDMTCHGMIEPDRVVL